MTPEEMKQVLRERQHGYKILQQFNMEEARRATFADRLRSFKRILALAKYFPRPSSREGDDEVTQKWITIRKNYANTK